MNSPELFIDSTNFPSQLKYYDAHFVNHESEHDYYDLIWRVILRDDQFGQHAKSFFGVSPYENTLDYDLFPFDEVVVKAVPISVPISYSSIPMCSAKYPGSCPPDLNFMSKDAIDNDLKNMEMFIKPNLFSWFIQAFLIFAFWTVITNNVSELLRKK